MGGGLIVPVGGREADAFATPMTASEEEVLADWNHAQDMLDEQVVRLRARGVCASAVVRQGVVETEVLAVASGRAATLLVVASRRRRGPRWLGTPAEAPELVRHNPGPGVLVNPQPPP